MQENPVHPVYPNSRRLDLSAGWLGREPRGEAIPLRDIHYDAVEPSVQAVLQRKKSSLLPKVLKDKPDCFWE